MVLRGPAKRRHGALTELKQELIVLKHTRKINEDDLKLPEWYELSQDYAEVTESTDKAVISIKNSILFQRRLVFCLTRDFTRELVKTDKNWKKAGLDNNAWTTILAKLVKSGLVELVREGKYKVPAVYKVIDSDVRKVLQVNEEQQLSESVEFAKKFESDRKADNKPDDKADAVVSNKNIVASSKATTVKSVIEKMDSAVLPDLEVSKKNITGLKVVNPEHAELLKQALAIPTKQLTAWELKFLNDNKEAKRLSDKQLTRLKEIAAKANPANPPKVPLKGSLASPAVSDWEAGKEARKARYALARQLSADLIAVDYNNRTAQAVLEVIRANPAYSKESAEAVCHAMHAGYTKSVIEEVRALLTTAINV